MTQLNSINRSLDRFVETKSLPILIEAFQKLNTLSSPVEEKGEARRERTRTWLRIMNLVEANKGWAPTKDDTAYLTICVPGVGGKGYPSGTDPKDIKDPETRAAYIKALEQNDKKMLRLNQQADIIKIDREFPYRMSVYLEVHYKSIDDKRDAAELIMQSHLSDARKHVLLDSLNRK